MRLVFQHPTRIVAAVVASLSDNHGHVIGRFGLFMAGPSLTIKAGSKQNASFPDG
jgi:hypothetical protein